MKKFLIRLKTIFLLLMIFVVCLTPVFLTLMAFSSCLTAVTVSAAETTTSGTSSSELIYDFDAVPLSIKADLYDDSGIKYDNYLIVKQSNIYRFMLFDSDVDFLDLGSTQLIFYKDDVSVDRKLYVIFYNHDGTFKKQHVFSTRSYEYFGYTYAYDYDKNSNDYIENWVNNVVYSSLDVKYNGLTVYYAKNNKAVTIKDLLDLPAGTGGGEIVGPQPIPSQPGDYNFIGPLPLIPIEGDPTFQGFKDWLIKNKKYEDLASYGINCTANNVSSIVDLWTGNYNSITSFFTGLKSTWSTISAITQAKNIYNWLEQQWQLYKKSLITYETIPIKDGVLNYETDYDEDGNFISSETSYLKLILGTLISFKDGFNSYVDTFVSYISSLDVNLNRLLNAVSAAPQYTADAIYNNLVNPFNLILDAINNSSGGTTTTENITNNYYNDPENLYGEIGSDYDDLISEYKQKYDNEINSKFPFISQVSLMFDEIWKACGYTESSSQTEVQTMRTTLNSTIGPQQTQRDYVDSKMSSVFGNYDSKYLENVDISDAPHYTVNIAGVECSVIDFRVFEKYKFLIHSVITLMLWVPFLLSLLKSIPGILAGVQDYMNIVATNNAIIEEANLKVEEQQSIFENQRIEDEKLQQNINIPIATNIRRGFSETTHKGGMRI